MTDLTGMRFKLKGKVYEIVGMTDDDIEYQWVRNPRYSLNAYVDSMLNTNGIKRRVSKELFDSYKFTLS